MEPEEQISFNVKPRRITNARRRSSLFDEKPISKIIIYIVFI